MWHSLITDQQYINKTAEAEGIGPNIIYEFTTVSDLEQGIEEVMESGVDAVWVIGRVEDFYDAVSIFEEVENRSDRVDGGGLFRLFLPVWENADLEGMLEVLGQAERLREASHWLMWPVFYHPNMRYGEESVLLGNSQQFVDGFMRRFGSEPTLLSAFAANSCLNLRQAIEIAAVDSPSVPTSAEIVAGLSGAR